MPFRNPPALAIRVREAGHANLAMKNQPPSWFSVQWCPMRLGQYLHPHEFPLLVAHTPILCPVHCRQTHDPFRGMYDAVFRPNKPPSSGEQLPLPMDAPDERPHATAPQAIAAAISNTPTLGVYDREEPRGLGSEPVMSTAATAIPLDGYDQVAPARGRDDVGGVAEEDEAETGGVTPFLPDERLTLEEAVWIYTVGGAIAAGAEDKVGVIRPGFLADLTVVEVPGGAEALLDNPGCGLLQ